MACDTVLLLPIPKYRETKIKQNDKIDFRMRHTLGGPPASVRVSCASLFTRCRDSQHIIDI